MFTWTKNKIRFCPPLGLDFSFCIFHNFRKSHKKSFNLSTSSCNSCRNCWNYPVRHETSIRSVNMTLVVNSVPKKSIASAVVFYYCACYTFFRNGCYYFNLGGKLTGTWTGRLWSMTDKSTSPNWIIWGQANYWKIPGSKKMTVFMSYIWYKDQQKTSVPTIYYK